MAGRDALRAIDPSDAPECRSGHPARSQRQCAPAAPDKLVPKQNARRPGARQRRQPDAEICGGEVSWRSSQKEFNAKRCALAAKSVQIANARQPLELPLPLKIIEGFGTSR